jgi:hypothetical protein
LRSVMAENARLRSALAALTDWGRTHTSPLDANSPHELLIAACAAMECTVQCHVCGTKLPPPNSGLAFCPTCDC